MKSIFSR